MASFATVADLGDFLGESLVGPRLSQATIALELATATIQGWTRRRLERVVGDVVVLAGTRGRELQLPESPVVTVSAVTIDRVAIPATSYDLIDSTLHRDLGWSGPGAAVQVTYTHGYDPIPVDIWAVTLQLAARNMTSPLGVRQESIGSYSVSYGGDDAGAGTDALLAALSRYRLRTASPSVHRESVYPLPAANA